MRHKAIIICISVVMFLLSFACANAETAIKTEKMQNGGVKVTTYSTEKQTQNDVYSLYKVKKVGGKWVRKEYMRDIAMPLANSPIDGKKYKYKSSEKEEIEWLKKNTIYRLFPTERGNHKSVPFWRNPLG